MTRQLSGHTRPFAVLGHPIGHTLSPVMHNAAIGALGLDAVYLAFDVAPERLMEVLPAMAAMGFGGVNLTVPLKEVAYRGLESLAASAQLLGAVNTVECTPEGLRGHNTDGEGFERAVHEAFGEALAGRRVFVLGCGGAGRAVALTCARAGAERLWLADVDAGRLDRLADELQALPEAPVVELAGSRAADWAREAPGADLVVQATPVGMRPGESSLLPPSAFRPGQHAYDLIYMYPRTPFMEAAEAAGARAANGLGMLLHQGARAFEIWTGTRPPVAVMRAALERAVYGEVTDAS